MMRNFMALTLAVVMAGLSACSAPAVVVKPDDSYTRAKARDAQDELSREVDKRNR